MEGHHYHQCWKCKHVWKHLNSCKGNARGHTCFSCNEQTWERYDPTPEEVQRLESTQPGECRRTGGGVHLSGL
jgi:hypothetical protein